MKNRAPWILAFILFGLLIWAVVIGYVGWTSAGGVELPSLGVGALIFGVVASLGLGIGLMALIFYSSRAGYDEPPTYIVTPEGNSEAQNNGDSDQFSPKGEPHE